MLSPPQDLCSYCFPLPRALSRPYTHTPSFSLHNQLPQSCQACLDVTFSGMPSLALPHHHQSTLEQRHLSFAARITVLNSYLCISLIKK